jgi:glucose dehydrogenase
MAESLTIDDVLYVGFNRRAAALDKRTGELIWSWKARDGSGFVSILLEGDQLFVSVQGYTYCLDATTGKELWMNPLKGFGVGAATLATSTGSSNHAILGEAQAAQQRAAQAAGTAS